MEDKRGNVILAPGPLHLFWTMGAYYLWELSRKYCVVLIVDEIYKENDDFKKACKLTNALEIFYVPSKGIVKKHLFYTNEFRRLIEKYRPKIIFHHDPIFVSMMYLYYWGKKIFPPSLRVSYATGLSASINFMKDFEILVDYDVTFFVNKYGLHKGFGRFLFMMKGWLKFLLDYYVLPLLFVGKFFSPPMSPYTFSRLKNYWNDQFDFYLLYKSLEKKIAGKIFGSEDGIRRIRPPIETVGKELHKVLYDFKEENIGLILPSSAHLKTYQKETGKSNEDMAKIISSKWIEAINAMKMKFTNYNFIWKLHPAQREDFLWQAITDKVKQEYPDLVVLSPEENAQKWILKSKVVVSEVSSVLWWSSFIGTKIAISFDIFGIPFMDFFKYYDGVYYFNNLKSFLETDFINRNISLSKESEFLPTLSDFLEGVCK